MAGGMNEIRQPVNVKKMDVLSVNLFVLSPSSYLSKEHSLSKFVGGVVHALNNISSRRRQTCS
jgi:hypothetical protein